MRLVFLVTLLFACASEEAELETPACQGDRCCVIPDDELCPASGCTSICLEVFDDDASAVLGVADYETTLAKEEGRAQRSFVSSDDARFVRVRGALERAWAMFRTEREVGALLDHRIALVMIDDPKPNAFIHWSFGFVVVAHTGLVSTDASDDALVGVMVHELQHLLGQDSSATDRLRDFYIAPDGIEPIGRTQVDDPTARRFALDWRVSAEDAGPHARAELGGMPIGGQLERVLRFVIARGDAVACADTRTLLAELDTDLAAAKNRITGELDLANATARVQEVLDIARTECATGDFITAVAQLAKTTPETIAARLDAHDRALVENKHVIEGIASLVADRRAAMRAAEAGFTAATGRPWSALRFFSIEEDADDVSASVLRAGGLAPDAVNGFFLGFLPEPARATCRDLLAARTVPPYGINLLDDHHATCWRAHHVRAIAESTPSSIVARTAMVPTTSTRTPLPIPPPVSARVRY